MYSEAHSGRPLLVVTGGTKDNNPRTEFYDFTWPGASWQLGEILKEHIFSKKNFQRGYFSGQTGNLLFFLKNDQEIKISACKI